MSFIRYVIFFITIFNIKLSLAFDPDIYTKHIIKQKKFWGNFSQKKLSEKVQVAPAEFIDYISRDNLNIGWQNIPRPPKSEIQPFINDFKEAINGLPDEVIKLVNHKIVAINLLENLGGTAVTDVVLDDSGKAKFGFMAFDVEALDKKANEWATWKENSPFNSDPEIKLVSYIEEEKNNNRIGAIRYVLLHELAHIINIDRPEFTPFHLPPKDIADIKNFEFTKITWIKSEDGERFLTKFKNDFWNSDEVKYYAIKKKQSTN